MLMDFQQTSEAASASLQAEQFQTTSNNNHYANCASNNLYHSSKNNNMCNINANKAFNNNTYLGAASRAGTGAVCSRLILNDSDTSSTIFLRLTSCDEVKRYSEP